MYFTIYKITNLLDGKFYIGKHQTKKLDDGYFGSGKLLGRAIRKHGKENFKKEILEVHDTEEAMNAAEKRLVVISEMSYNLCEGGNGGFSFINDHTDAKEWKSKGGKAAIGNLQRGSVTPRSDAARLKMSESHKLIKPGNFGMTYKQRKHNPNSHPKGPRGPYKKLRLSTAS
jgi:hypothetical protein